MTQIIAMSERLQELERIFAAMGKESSITQSVQNPTQIQRDVLLATSNHVTNMIEAHDANPSTLHEEGKSTDPSTLISDLSIDERGEV